MKDLTASEIVELLGPEDYLVFPTSVHVMRYGGRNDDGYRFWRIACGSRISEERWGYVGVAFDADDVVEQNFAFCGNCRRTHPAEIGATS